MPASIARPVSIAGPAFAVAVALLVIGTVLRATFLLWHPPFGVDFYDYEQMTAFADTYFPFHLYVGAPGFAILFIGLAAVTATMTRARAGLLAVIGGVIASVGGVAFAFGLAAEGLVWGSALDPSVIDPEAGAALLRGIEAGPQVTTLILVASGSVVLPIGVLLQLIALAVSRSVPLWLPIATTVILLLALVPIPAIDGPRVVLETIALLTIAVYAVRDQLRSRDRSE